MATVYEKAIELTTANDGRVYGYATEGSGGTYASSTNNFGNLTDVDKRSAHYRFSGLAIPVNAYVTAAYIKFKAKTSLSGANCNVRIFAEDAEQPVAPNTPALFWGKTLSALYVDWNNIPAWVANTWYQTPDISNLVQYLIDTYGTIYALMSFYIWNNASTTGAYRAPYDYSDGAAQAPILHVEYETQTVIGYITGLIEEKIFQAGDVAAGAWSRMVNIGGDNYAVDYRSNDTIQAKIFTVPITQAGDIGDQIAMLSNYDYANQGDSDLIPTIYDHIYLSTHDAGGNDGYLWSFEISEDGLTITELVTWEFDTSFGVNPRVYQIKDNIYAVIYRTNLPAGGWRIITFSLSAVGAFTQIDTEFFASSISTQMMVKVSGTTWAILTSGTSSPGIQTITISDAGAISAPIASDTTFRGIYIIELSDLKFAVFTNVGQILTLPISADGLTIGPQIDSRYYDGAGTVSQDGTDVVDLGSQTYAIYAHRNSAGSTYSRITTVNLQDDGTCGRLIANLQFNDNIVSGSPREQVFHINDEVYCCLYPEQGTGVKIRTVQITPGGLPDRIYVFLGTEADPLETELTLPGYPTVLLARTERGRDEELGHAQAGIAEIVCDNFYGDYSIENVSGHYYGKLDLGKWITVFEIYLGVQYDHFVGKIEKIQPHGEPDNLTASLLCVDGMDDLAQQRIYTPLRTSTQTGVLIGDILDAAGWSATARALDTGVDTFGVAWFHAVSALEGIQNLEETEASFFYVGVTGIATWEDRHHRLVEPHLTSQADFEDTMVEMVYEYSKRDIRNYAAITGHNYTEDPAGETYLWGVPCNYADGPYIGPGDTLTLWAEFDSPLFDYDTPLTAGVHYAANSAWDGSGTDLTAQVTVAETRYGQAIKLVFTNASSQNAFLIEPIAKPWLAPSDMTCIIMGTLYVDNPVTIITEDATSQASYGKKTKEVEATFLSNPNDVRSYSQWLIARYKDPVPTAVSARFVARTNWPDNTIRIQCLTRAISDRITLKSTKLGFDRDFYINKVIQEYVLGGGGMIHETTWYVERAQGSAEGLYWLLGVVGFGELGTKTVLGY